MTEWQAFAELEPFGGTIEDIRAGIAPAATINVNKTEGAATTPLDFYSWHRKPEPAAPEALDPDEPGISEQERARRKIMALAS